MPWKGFHGWFLLVFRTSPSVTKNESTPRVNGCGETWVETWRTVYKLSWPLLDVQSMTVDKVLKSQKQKYEQQCPVRHVQNQTGSL